MTDNLDAFTRAFLECTLWASSDDEDTPLNAQYDIRDFAPETLEKLIVEDSGEAAHRFRN